MQPPPSKATSTGTGMTPASSTQTSSFFKRTAPATNSGTVVTGSTGQPQTQLPTTLNGKQQPRQQPKQDNIKSPIAKNTVSPEKSPVVTEKLPSAPEPPRWRFVNEARKSRGYSSAHAGVFIRGQSSDELGAKYLAPDISLDKPKKTVLEVHDLEYELPANISPANDDRRVGKLTSHQAARDETKSPSSGTFPGLPERGSSVAGSRKPFKEWDTTLEAGSKKQREHEWQGGGDIRDSYTNTMPGDGTTSKTRGGEVGKTMFRGPWGSEETFDREAAKGNCARAVDGGVGLSDVDSCGDVREGALFLHTSGSPVAGERDSRDLVALIEGSKKDAKKKRRCFFLLLLVPLLLGILATVLLGQSAEDSEMVIAGVMGGVLLPPIIVANETAAPSPYPSSSPSIASPSPSIKQTQPPKSPSVPPSNLPTTKPTCRSTEQEFNLCLAVDMSGSVCNDSSGSDCLECSTSPSLFASVLNIFFASESECRDSFVSEDTCCANFAIIKDFSSLIVNSLADIPVKKSFSVVQFATNAQLVSGLSSEAQTLSVIDKLDYAGGLTNHAAAIQECQETFSATGNRKNFIMLITDGVSSEPNVDPEGAAETAARLVKNDETFITPVFISPENDWSALSFMKRLSSDGRVFDVTDFGSLNSLQQTLVDQVSCS